MFFEEVTKKADEGKTIHIVHMDFSKAFDEVPLGRLLWRVRTHGIQAELANGTEKWLHGRRQRVMIESCFTD